MSQVRIATGAKNLSAHHQEAEIFFVGDRGLINRRPKARPASAGIKLGIRPEQRRITTDTPVEAGIFGIPIGARESSLSPVFPSDLKLLRGELGPPLFFAFPNFFGHGSDVSVVPAILTTRSEELSGSWRSECR